VDEGVAVAHEAGRRGGEADAHLVTAGLGAGVADRSSGIDAAGTGNGAGAGENGLKECCLTALERAHQCDAPWTAGTSDVMSHCRLLFWSSALDWVGGWDAPPTPAFWQAGNRRHVYCSVQTDGSQARQPRLDRMQSARRADC